MKKLVFLVSLVVVALLAYGVALRSYAQKKTNDETEIRALHQRYSSAFNKKDVTTIMSCYAAGQELFVFDAIPPREYPSWEAYKKDWEGLFAAYPGPAHDEISDLKITADGNLAFSHHVETGHFTRANGSRMDWVVRVTDAYRKINGKWLIVHEHVSFPVDLETSKADLTSKP